MLKLELDSIDGVDESLRGLYEEAEGKYKLKVEGIEDTGALKRAKQHEVDARKKVEAEARELKERLAEIEASNKKTLEDGIRKSGDVEALDKSWQEKLAKRESELLSEVESTKGHLQKLLVDSVAMKMAVDLAVDGASEVLMPHIKQRLSVELRNGEPTTVIREKDGSLSAMTLAELQEEFANNAAFAAVIRGSKAAGAGGHGAGNGGGAALGSKKLSDMTSAEKSAYIEKHGLEAWQKLVNSQSK
jgi:hypothetical protein